MTITFTDSESNVYTLPSDFKVKSVESFPVDRRSRDKERAFSDGSVQIGDRKLKSRKITVEGRIVTEDWTTLMSNFLKWFAKDEELEFRYTANQFAKVRILGFEPSELLGPEGGNRTSEFEMELEMLDPYFYSNSSYLDDVPISYDPVFGQTITVPNNGDMIVFPVLTFLGYTSIPSFSLRNTTDGGRIFYYQDSGFGNGDVVEIDCAVGTVERDGVDMIGRFYGTFLRLLSGDNTLAYESNADFSGTQVILTVEYRCRFLHAEGPDCETSEIIS